MVRRNEKRERAKGRKREKAIGREREMKGRQSERKRIRTMKKGEDI